MCKSFCVCVCAKASLRVKASVCKSVCVCVRASVRIRVSVLMRVVCV